MKGLNIQEDRKKAIKDFLLVAKKSFFFAGFFSLFINILMLLPAIYMLAVYDIVVPSRSSNTLLFITLLVIGLFIIMNALQIIRGRILVRINNKLDYVLNKKVVNSMYELALKHPTKATIQPFEDFQQIKQFLTGASIFAFFDAPWIPIYLGVLYLFHPYYGNLGVIVVLVVIIITITNEIVTKKYLKKANANLIKSKKFLNNTIGNTEVIEAMGMKSKIYNKWLDIYRDYMTNLQIASDKGTFWSNTMKTFRMLSQSLMLGMGGYLALNLEISSGMIVAGSIVLGRALAPLDLMVNTWKSFSSARESYKRLNSLLSEIEDEKQVLKLPEPKGKISLVNVIVLPPNSKTPLLKGITMNINPGESVAVVGPSGAGKSSLARTMLGIWKPVNGIVEIDDADIKQWDREYLGKFIGYLPQDIELFEGTVAENIARFEDIDEEKILEAAKISGAHDVIVKLPDGYNTYIGPGGITLSGGQRQRIALARALYGNPRIVILDEPNSNLDDAGERALLNALRILKEKKTTFIVISHKVNILDLVDKIAVLKDGTLTMYGDRDTVLLQLMSKRG